MASSAPSSPLRSHRREQLSLRPQLLTTRSIPSSPSSTASTSTSAALLSPRARPSTMAPTSFSSAVVSPPVSSSSSSTSSVSRGAVASGTPVPTPPSSATNVAGTLRVEVMSARNLHAAVLGSLLKWTANTSNPYVVVTLHRDEFTTTTKDQTLNPTWKEMGHLSVPLPSEQELLQTVGMHRSVYDTGSHPSGGFAAGKLGGKVHTKTVTTGAPGGSGDFHACFPHLHVQVFHQTDSALATTQQPSASASPRTRRAQDKLIGEVAVPLLPCLMASTSSHRAWYTLLSDEHPDAGQIQLALHYDVGGLEPLKGDVVRLAGFGGMEYYAKFVNANARLDVIDVFQDEVLVQYKSIENWLLSFEVHRNLLWVVRRPSMLRDAQSQLHGQIIRVRHSPLVAKAHSVWQVIPQGQRRQLHHLYELAVFSGGAVYGVVTKSVDTALHEGVHAGVQTCMSGSSEAVTQVSHEALKRFWSSANETRASSKRPTRADEMQRYLEGGPLSGRGKVVQAFGFGGSGSDTTTAATIAALTDVSGLDDEEKVDDGDGVVFTVDDDHEAFEQEAMIDDDDETKMETLYDDGEEKTNDDGDDDHNDLWGDDDVPEQLICPITGCAMLDPVVAADGHSYEREAIVQWFAGSNKSPMTGAQMETTQVFPNFTLKRMSEELQETRRAAVRRRGMM